MTTLPKELQKLRPAERILLAEDLWDSVVDSPSTPEVSDAQKDELDRRLAEYDKTPGGNSWSEVRDRLRGKS